MTRAKTRCEKCGTGIYTRGNLCLACDLASSDGPRGSLWSPPQLRSRLEELKARGWTQRDIADELGVDQSTVSRLMAGTIGFSEPVRRRMANLFDLRLSEAGLDPDLADVTPDAMRMIAGATSAAHELRNRGDVIGAADALWPAIEYLENRSRAQRTPELMHLHLQALAVNTRVVGDLATHATRTQALNHALRALHLAEVLDDKTEIARTGIQVGNQLRIAGEPERAVEQLTKSYALSETHGDKATSSERAARAAIDAGDRGSYERFMIRTYRELHHCRSDALINEATVRDLEIRAHIAFGIRTVAAVEVAHEENAAPQWKAIGAITRGADVLAEGELEEGLSIVEAAATNALALRLPRQAERAAKVARDYGGKAGAELGRLIDQRTAQLNVLTDESGE